MLSQVRRGHHHDFDDSPMSTRTINGHGEHWKSSDRANASLLNNNILPDVYPSARSISSIFNPDLSRAFRADVHLLAIIRIEDKRNSFYSADVVTKLRQKEQTQSFINKPCSLFVTDRSLIIYDRATQIIAETVPLEIVDPTCVYSDSTDTLNDIFMYRILDRPLATTTTSQASNSNSHETTSVIVFKCTNKDSKLLVDTIRNLTGRTIRNPRSPRSETRNTIDRHITDTGGMSFYDPQQPPQQQLSHEPPPIINPPYVGGSGSSGQHTSRTINQQQSTMLSADHYRHLTEELNKCFDDIELFVRYLESLVEYTKELERDHRRKEKKSTVGLKQMVEKLPDDRFFIDILQKFKHSFNLLGELKHIIHNPNAPELIHYLLSPLQFIIYTLRTKHMNQLQLAQDIWTPALTKESRDLLVNCLTSKEHEILRNLGPAWIRTADESPQKFTEYRPVFFEGRPIWFQESSTDRQLHSERSIDERQPSVWSTTRQSNQNNNNNGLSINPSITIPQQPSPSTHFNPTTIDRSTKNSSVGGLENYNAQLQNEHAWAIDRKRAGARICAVKIDRQGQNNKELTVRRGELIEIENSSKKWWRARNFHGDVGHVPHNIVEEIEIEQRPIKPTTSNPSAFIPRSSSAPNWGRMNVNGHRQKNADNYPHYLLRSPSHGNNFIMQSNNSSSTKPILTRDQLFEQKFSSTNSSTPLPPPLPSSIPPPPPLPEHLLTIRSSLWSTLQLPDSIRIGRSDANTNSPTPRVDEFQQELTQRVTDRVGLINQNSTSEDVQRWLASKNISSKLAQNLYGMNGQELFQLSKNTLDQLTNETESSRLYTLLSQQKKLSGYRSEDMSERSPFLTNSAIGSRKASTINDADDNLSFRLDDTLTRSLKIKLKQRRDKIEQSESTNRIVV